MDQIILILDYFEFFKTKYNIIDYKEKIEDFIKRELTIKKRNQW